MLVLVSLANHVVWVLPLMQNTKIVEPFTAHYVFTLGIARFLSCAHWVLQVRQISHIALRRDHEYVNTIQEGSEETHAQARQMQIVAPLEKHFSLLCAILKEHIADDLDYKIGSS